MTNIGMRRSSTNLRLYSEIRRTVPEQIIGYGIIAYYIERGVPRYLTICRRASIGAHSFILGKYHKRPALLRTLISQCTTHEIYMIDTMSFDDLWTAWVSSRIAPPLDMEGADYIDLVEKSVDKARAIYNATMRETNRLETVYDHLRRSGSPIGHIHPQYEFPKGRSSANDRSFIDVAKREFIEELSLPPHAIDLLPPTGYRYFEHFRGSDGIPYLNVYYTIACSPDLRELIETTSNDMSTPLLNYEASYCIWQTAKELINSVREYPCGAARIDILSILDSYIAI